MYWWQLLKCEEENILWTGIKYPRMMARWGGHDLWKEMFGTWRVTQQASTSKDPSWPAQPPPQAVLYCCLDLGEGLSLLLKGSGSPDMTFIYLLSVMCLALHSLPSRESLSVLRKMDFIIGVEKGKQHTGLWLASCFLWTGPSGWKLHGFQVSLPLTSHLLFGWELIKAWEIDFILSSLARLWQSLSSVSFLKRKGSLRNTTYSVYI